MIGKILKSTFGNFQAFLVAWVVILVINQLFIFHGCFAPYCLLAGLPHTGIIAAFITYVMNNDDDVAAAEVNTTAINHEVKTNTLNKQAKDIPVNHIKETKEPFCPKCGSKMRLNTARKGRYAGQNFWGCSKYPHCNGIVNI